VELAVLDPETGRQCSPARFGPGGELLNAAEAVGELVNTSGPGLFAGYYHDAEADASWPATCRCSVPTGPR
jgi:fatty-acyl-CoA synthase